MRSSAARILHVGMLTFIVVLQAQINTVNLYQMNSNSTSSLQLMMELFKKATKLWGTLKS